MTHTDDAGAVYTRSDVRFSNEAFQLTYGSVALKCKHLEEHRALVCAEISNYSSALNKYLVFKQEE
jgi:hypothetical protein